MRFCTECGGRTEEGQAFCPSCGAPVPAAGPGAPQAPPGSRESPYPARARALSAEEELSSRPRGPIPLPSGRILSIILVVLIIAAGAFVVISGTVLPTGKIESAGADVPKSSGIRPTGSTCPEGMTLCRELCVDLKTDNDNCGACGFTVPYGMVCRNGEFTSLSPTVTTLPLPSPTASPTPLPSK